ncbi:MAG: hypothetical protein QOD40_777 [Alphaproteobacteria bacterium]|nr:hypothetical protein [Alphaproteobacteria bacterium]
MLAPAVDFMQKLIAAIFVLALVGAQAQAQSRVWQPSLGHAQTLIWPRDVPNSAPVTKSESVRSDWPKVTDVNQPTFTVYPPKGNNTDVTVVVFPGGGYQFLAMDLEGTEICDWLTSRGITCVLLKYRVPDSGPTWKNGHRYYPEVHTALQDAQRTLGLLRQRAARWHIDPHKVGVMGFSAGGHLVAAVSTQFTQRTYPPVDDADELSSRPDFAIILYPGHLWAHEDDPPAIRNQADLTLRADIRVRSDTPPTFIVHAQDDPRDAVEESLTYYLALKRAGVPSEMHLYAHGGHAFGLRPTNLPVSRWPDLVEQWLRTIGMLAAPESEPEQSAGDSRHLVGQSEETRPPR